MLTQIKFFFSTVTKPWLTHFDVLFVLISSLIHESYLASIHFAEDCLKEYVRESPLFNCPLCRTKHTLPSTGVDGLRKNFYLDEPTKYKMCVEHPKEDLRFFCCHCRTQICRDCKIVSHEGHATEMADNVVAKTRETLEESLNDANISITETGTALIATIEQELKEHETSIKVLTTHARIMKHAIDKLLIETVAMI